MEGQALRQAQGRQGRKREKMKRKIVKITALAIIVCFSTSANATPISVGLTSVDVVPEQPLETDIITFDISGGASLTSSWVEYDEFTQNGTSLQLDLYVDMGNFTAISYWEYSKEILPLPTDTYTLEVRAFDYKFPEWGIQDTYTVDFTVVPEPASVVLFGLGLLIVKPLTRRKRKGANIQEEL